MISSTAKDLADYREQVKQACLRLGVHPMMMEHLPALDADAIVASLAMVDAAEIYVGVFAHRYGYVPAGREASITEMEYERAARKGMPRLLFLAAEDTVAAPEYADQGAAADKLAQLKERIKKDRVVKFFRDPVQLREEVILSLARYCDLAAARSTDVNPVPQPPAPYLAHPYTLLQTPDLVGRRAELQMLTDWIRQPERFNAARILSVVGLGGTGKSALTWKWFSDLSPQIIPGLCGRLWWSFYEPDASFESFIDNALAYVSRRPVDEVERDAFSERERKLLAALDRDPYVLVLDGLERAMIAYARSDAPRLLDAEVDDVLSGRAEGSVVEPPAPQSTSRRHHQLRTAADPRAGRFLRSLSRIKASRILISTRLHPADLQLLNGGPVPGAFAYELPGLASGDAIALWQAYGTRGDAATLIPLFRRFDNHPLLVQALANEVVNFRAAPGDFDAWRAAHPEFDPFAIPLEQVKPHVLDTVLRGLGASFMRTLQVIAAFRMPARFDTLAAVLVRQPPASDHRPDYDPALGSFGDVVRFSGNRSAATDSDERSQALPVDRLAAPYRTVAELDRALAELEGRGLVGWDRGANRYDLHPITQAGVWAGLSHDDRHGIHESLRMHFEALPRFDQQNSRSLEELAPAIELFGTLMALGRYAEAAGLYQLQLSPLGDTAPGMALELLEGLFQQAKGQLGIESRDQALLLRDLGMAYRCVGRPDRLVATVRPALELLNEDWDRVYPLSDIATESCAIGQIFAGEAAARQSLAAGRAADPRWLQPVALFTLARCLAVRGVAEEAMLAINRSQVMFQRRAHTDWAARARVLGLEMLLRRNLVLDAFQIVNSTIGELTKDGRFAKSAAMLQLRRIRATAEARLGGLAGAEEKLEQVLAEAHSRYWVDEELTAMIALAHVRRRQGKREAAGLLLQDARELAQRGQYRLQLADIENEFARLALDEGDRTLAATALGEAYRLSWCDGPPFAYAWGIDQATRQFDACGLERPDGLVPFDATRHEEMPQIDINPPDEWHIDDDSYGTTLIGGFGAEPGGTD